MMESAGHILESKKRPILYEEGTFNLYFPKQPSKVGVLKKNGVFFIDTMMDSVQ